MVLGVNIIQVSFCCHPPLQAFLIILTTLLWPHRLPKTNLPKYHINNQKKKKNRESRVFKEHILVYTNLTFTRSCLTPLKVLIWVIPSAFTTISPVKLTNFSWSKLWNLSSNKRKAKQIQNTSWIRNNQPPWFCAKGRAEIDFE